MHVKTSDFIIYNFCVGAKLCHIKGRTDLVTEGVWEQGEEENIQT
jgi:hypothetical protein